MGSSCGEWNSSRVLWDADGFDGQKLSFYPDFHLPPLTTEGFEHVGLVLCAKFWHLQTIFFHQTHLKMSKYRRIITIVTIRKKNVAIIIVTSYLTSKVFFFPSVVYQLGSLLNWICSGSTHRGEASWVPQTGAGINLSPAEEAGSGWQWPTLRSQSSSMRRSEPRRASLLCCWVCWAALWHLQKFLSNLWTKAAAVGLQVVQNLGECESLSM